MWETHTWRRHPRLCTHRGRQSRALAVFLWCSLPYAMRQGISLNQQNSLFWLRLAGQQAPRLGLSAPTKAGVPGAHGHAQLFIWCWGCKLRSSHAEQVCLPSVSSPQPWDGCFQFNGLSFGEILTQQFSFLNKFTTTQEKETECRAGDLAQW